MSAKLSNSDISAWVMNVISCVAIIMVNKQLMSSQGYAFNFSTTLCGLHFIVTGCASRLLKRYQDGRPQDRTAADEEADRSAAKDKKSTLPLSDLIIFVVAANLSIVSLNTSLMVNTVSLYQIAKLGIPPVTAVVERVWFGNALSGLQILAMAVTLAGIGLVTVAELNVSGNTSFGVLVAMVSVLSSSSQQILCGHYQRKNAMSSNDFLNAVSMWQGISCLAVGPILDVIISGKWVFSYSFTLGSFSFLVLSCLNSVLVNASHFMCLGRFSAVTYQILGHTKTICVLTLGYYLFGGSMSEKQVFGGILAIAGMGSYGFFTSKKNASKMSSPPPTPKPDTKVPDGEENV